METGMAEREKARRGRLGQEIVEWNSTPEAEEAPQGLFLGRGKREGVEGAECKGMNL
jgi:hypothetical protein